MTETEKMLKTVLVMQAEILGRLEALEQAVSQDHQPMEDRLKTVAGLSRGRDYDDPRLEALSQLRDRIESSESGTLDTALRDITALVNNH